MLVESRNVATSQKSEQSMTLTYAVTDPHSGVVVQTYPTATARDVANALAAAGLALTA